jgi:hypothetical protein
MGSAKSFNVFDNGYRCRGVQLNAPTAIIKELHCTPMFVQGNQSTQGNIFGSRAID